MVITIREKALLIGFVALLSGTALAAEPSGTAEPEAPAASGGEDDPTGLYFDDEGLNYRSADGVVKLNLGGRFHADYGDGDVDPEEPFPDAFIDNVFHRRGRLEFQANIADRVSGVYQYDFRQGDSTPIKDAGIGFYEKDRYVVSVGNMKEPFSFEELVSSNNTTFPERSLANTFAPSRNTGAAVGAAFDTWTVTAGVFGGNLNETVQDGGIAGSARVTYAPIYDRDNRHFLHFGVAANYRELEDEQTLGFDTDPESAGFNYSLVDTGDILGAEDVFRLGLEAAYMRGPYRVQGEYILADVSGAGPGGTFQAGYVEGAYVFGGKNRNYSLVPSSGYGTGFGIFGAVEPEKDNSLSGGGFGVWEAAARFSAIDLQDGFVQGGAEQNYSLGLNWYPEKNLRFMVNYVRAEAQDSPGVGDVSADIIQGRAQLYF